MFRLRNTAAFFMEFVLEPSHVAKPSVGQGVRRQVRGRYGRNEAEVIDDDLHITIFRTGRSPRWYAQYNVASGQRRKSLKTKNRKEARRRALTLAGKLRAGETDPAAKRGPRIMDAVELFLKNRLRRGRRLSTVTEYRRALEQFNHFCGEHGIVRLDQVGDDQLEEFERQLRDRGIAIRRERKRRGRTAKPNKPTSVHMKIKLVKSLMKWAVKRKLLRENPISGYELPAPGDPDSYCFSTDEVNRICNAAGEFFGQVFRFLALTGLRQGELVALTKVDLDVERRFVRIRSKLLDEKGSRWHPKTDGRVVPLSAAALAIANAMVALGNSRWLFPAPPAAGVKDDRLRACRLWAQLRKAKAAAGVERGTLHSFRHHFVSTMANANVSPFKVMRIVGHKSLDIILTYYHVGSEELLNAVEGVDFGTADSSYAGTAAAVEPLASAAEIPTTAGGNRKRGER